MNTNFAGKVKEKSTISRLILEDEKYIKIPDSMGLVHTWVIEHIREDGIAQISLNKDRRVVTYINSNKNNNCVDISKNDCLVGITSLGISIAVS